ncbi:MAG TPA: phospholipase D family protein [Burkholderiales bacterium]|nr:phospholipase D family protein [Burkholderiales bacterium]
MDKPIQMRFSWWCALGLLWLTPSALALQPADAVEETVTAQIAFTPGGDPARIIVEALHAARRQILVQAFSFTHRDIARALIEAQRRGVDVQVIADAEQTELIENSVIPQLASAGVPVFLDREHVAAHNKVMVIDEGHPSAVVITGSYNFTFGAQFRNAENLVLLRGGPHIARAYADNWRTHRAHSRPYSRP